VRIVARAASTVKIILTLGAAVRIVVTVTLAGTFSPLVAKKNADVLTAAVLPAPRRELGTRNDPRQPTRARVRDGSDGTDPSSRNEPTWFRQPPLGRLLLIPESLNKPLRLPGRVPCLPSRSSSTST